MHALDDVVNAQLTSDAGYLRLQDVQSRGPFAYVVNPMTTQQGQPRWAQGRVDVGVGPSVVNTYNHLLGSYTRNDMPAASNRPNTELFGTAPYKTIGRGGLLNDQGAALTFATGATLPQRTRRITEGAYNRYDFIDVPTAVQDTMEDRAGSSSRAGPVYVR